MSDEVTSEDADGIRIITLNRPAVRNAVDATTAALVADALDGLDADGSLRVGILTGAGGYFSAGADLRALARGERPAVTGRGLAGLTERVPKKPLIAAVEGFAIGGGLEMALACDLIVAAETARFALPEVKRGLLAAGGGLLRLPARIPRNVAMEMVLTGGSIDALRGYSLGLVNRVVPTGGARAGALTLVHEIAANGPLAVTYSKLIMNETFGKSISAGFDEQRPFVERVLASNDAQEGTSAFTERRLPVWNDS